MNELLQSLSHHIPERIRVERQGSSKVYSVWSDDMWLPVYQHGVTSGFWVHGERHLEYGLRAEADARQWDWSVESVSGDPQARVRSPQRMCSEHGQPPVYDLACALLNLLDQGA